jgi:Cu/Ag efflux protein CusF
MLALRRLAAFGFAIALLGASRGPFIRPYEVVLYGTVRSVDLRHGRITIAYAPLDTAPGGIRSMRVTDRRDLEFFVRGDPIQAIADTRRTPWVVRDLHRMQ